MLSCTEGCGKEISCPVQQMKERGVMVTSAAEEHRRRELFSSGMCQEQARYALRAPRIMAVARYACNLLILERHAGHPTMHEKPGPDEHVHVLLPGTGNGFVCFATPQSHPRCTAGLVLWSCDMENDIQAWVSFDVTHTSTVLVCSGAGVSVRAKCRRLLACVVPLLVSFGAICLPGFVLLTHPSTVYARGGGPVTTGALRLSPTLVT